MNCINLRIRTKNYKKYFYCICNKCIVDASTCYCCKSKEYKSKTKLNRTKKSERTKACSIPESVKLEVWNRDNHQCVFCKKTVPHRCANSHIIPRSQGGLGIPENIITVCPECHHEQDNGKNTEYYDKLAKLYIENIYKNWEKEKVIYKKYEI